MQRQLVGWSRRSLDNSRAHTICEGFQLRRATRDDAPELEALIAVSARDLSRGYYDEQQTDAAIAHVFGVDSALLEDGTYFVAEAAGVIVGCGGWSKRRTLFGGDQYAERDSSLSDPMEDAAKIRAFFVHPSAARRGIARALLAQCEEEAHAAGFRSAELMSTLPGVPFYQSAGYHSRDVVTLTVGNATELQFMPMWKLLH